VAAAVGHVASARGIRSSTLSVSVLLDDDANHVSSLLIAYGSHIHANMGALEHSIQVLKVIQPVLDMVPAIGGNLKGAAELASEICEMVKVCGYWSGYVDGQ
jgi:hypothetical protein